MLAPPTQSTILWRVRYLGVCFFLNFFAYSSAQTLESTLNGASGFMCLSLVYIAISLSYIVSPYIVSLFGEARLPSLFFCAALPYVFMVSTKLLPRSPGVAAVSLLSCAGVGLGGGPLWSAQGFFIARATAAMHAAAPPGDSATPSTISTRLNSVFFSISMLSGFASNTIATLVMLSFSDVASAVRALFSLLTAVGCAGLVAYSLLPSPGEAGGGVVALPFFLRPGRSKLAAALPAAAGGEPAACPEAPTARLVLAGGAPGSAGDAAAPPPAPRRGSWIPWPEPEEEAQCAGAGAGAGAGAPALPPASGAPPEDATVPSPLYMLRFMAATREVWHVAPVSFAAGAGQGFVTGAWMAAVVADTVGADYVGLVGAAFCASSAACAALWGRLAQRPAYGRRTAFALSHALLLAWYLANAGAWWGGGLSARASALALLRAGAGAGAAAQPLAGQQLPPPPLPLPLLLPLLLAASVLVAAVDPVFQAFVSATMQVYFPAKPNLACAVAAPRFFYGLGFSLQQLLALSLSAALGRPAIGEQCLLHAALVCVSAASLWALHTRVRPIDPPAAAAAPPAG